jgi:hypothetical protein
MFIIRNLSGKNHLTNPRKCTNGWFLLITLYCLLTETIFTSQLGSKKNKKKVEFLFAQIK